MKAREIKMNKIKSYADAINKNKQKQQKTTEEANRKENTEENTNKTLNAEEFPALTELTQRNGTEKTDRSVAIKNTAEAKKSVTTNLDEKLKQMIRDEVQKYKETIMNEVKTFIEKTNEKMMKEMEEMKKTQESIKKAQNEIKEEQQELKNMIKEIRVKQDDQQTEMKDELKVWFGEAIKALMGEMRSGVSETVGKVLDDQIEERRRSRSKSRAGRGVQT
jgi:hypothetical protein